MILIMRKWIVQPTAVPCEAIALQQVFAFLVGTLELTQSDYLFYSLFKSDALKKPIE